MKEWVFRTYEHQDWITYLFFINFLILAFLNLKFKTQFQKLLSFFQISTYSSNYFVENSKSSFRIFNIGCFIILISSFNLWFYFMIDSLGGATFYPFEFYTIFLIMGVFFIARYLLTEGVIQFVSNGTEVKQYLVKSTNYTILSGIFMLLFLLIYHYSNANSKVLFYTSGLVIFLWLIAQSIVVFDYLKNNIKDFIYIIFYLCVIKIAPWLWFYKLVIETRL